MLFNSVNFRCVHVSPAALSRTIEDSLYLCIGLLSEPLASCMRVVCPTCYLYPSPHHAFYWNRLLSGTSCRNSSDCPGINWSKTSWHYQYAQRCSEVLGYCAFDNYCWGVDSLTHVCVLWPWLFSRLHGVVSAFWPRDKAFLELTRCVSKYYPEERCNWAYLRKELAWLQQHAARELVGSWSNQYFHGQYHECIRPRMDIAKNRHCRECYYQDWSQPTSHAIYRHGSKE